MLSWGAPLRQAIQMVFSRVSTMLNVVEPLESIQCFLGRTGSYLILIDAPLSFQSAQRERIRATVTPELHGEPLKRFVTDRNKSMLSRVLRMLNANRATDSSCGPKASLKPSR
jgi:hypothetical protein